MQSKIDKKKSKKMKDNKSVKKEEDSDDSDDDDDSDGSDDNGDSSEEEVDPKVVSQKMETDGLTAEQKARRPRLMFPNEVLAVKWSPQNDDTLSDKQGNY